MMKIDNQTKALIFFNVVALAVGIIGIIAFKQLGAFNHWAPLKGVVMMGSAGTFFLIELAMYSIVKKSAASELKPTQPTFYPPSKDVANWTIIIPGLESGKPLEFLPVIPLSENALKPDKKHFILYSITNREGRISLQIVYWTKCSSGFPITNKLLLAQIHHGKITNEMTLRVIGLLENLIQSKALYQKIGNDVLYDDE